MTPGHTYDRSYDGRGDSSDNTTWDKRFQEDNPLCQHIHEWKIVQAMAVMKDKGKVTPLNGTKPRCITYHVKGTCFLNCCLSYDHNPLSSVVKEEMFEWCREAFA